jgi:hypothetical protein
MAVPENLGHFSNFAAPHLFLVPIYICVKDSKSRNQNFYMFYKASYFQIIELTNLYESMQERRIVPSWWLVGKPSHP